MILVQVQAWRELEEARIATDRAAKRFGVLWEKARHTNTRDRKYKRAMTAVASLRLHELALAEREHRWYLALRRTR